MDQHSPPPANPSQSFVSIGDFLRGNNKKVADAAGPGPNQPASGGQEKHAEHAPPQIELERAGSNISRLTLRCGCGEVHVLELRLAEKSADQA